MSDLVLGSSILGGFIGGVLALFAPCCITVLLPTYFASAFRTVGTLARMTFLFAAGIALVVVPIAIGLAALGSALTRYHLWLFLAGGSFLLVLGVLTLRGRGFEIPFLRAPAMDGRAGGSVFALGVFSGAASSCCAPVLVGVLTLTALTDSLPGALAVALAYVFGMVFPLFLLALAGDRLGWARSRLVAGRVLSFRLGRRAAEVHSTNLIAGALFIAMGAFVIVLALTGNEFLTLPGQTELGVSMQNLGDQFLLAARGIPGLAVAVALIGLVAFLWRRARVAGPIVETDDEPS